MPNFICTTCGTQYAESDQPPAACAICQDERQYVKATGQQWTTLDKLRLTNRNSIKFKEPGLIGIGIEPHFAIGQRALFLRTPKANVLWDCLPLLDEAVVEAIQAMGGISAIAISHPHYYASMSSAGRVPCAASEPWRGCPPPRQAWPDRGENGCRSSDAARQETPPRSPSRTRPACPRSRGPTVLSKDLAHALAWAISRWTSSLVAEIRASANHTRFWVSSLDDIESFVSLLGLEPINREHDLIDRFVLSTQGFGVLLTCGEHHLVTPNVLGDGIDGELDRVVVQEVRIG